MVQENVDPVYAYVDDNIQKLKGELSSDLINLHEELLKTQRFLAELSARTTHNESISHTEAFHKASSQFVSEITSALLEIRASDKPLSIANNFGSKRWNDLGKLDVKSV